MNKPDQFFCVLDGQLCQHDISAATIHEACRPSMCVSQQLEDAVISYALQVQKPLALLSKQDFIALLHHQQRNNLPEIVIGQATIDRYQQVIAIIIDRLQHKIQAGSKLIEGTTILHTAPHHDDIILGYHAYAMRNLEHNKNYVAYITSGSNGVSHEYLIDFLSTLTSSSHQNLFQTVFEYFYQQLVEQFAQAFHIQDDDAMQQAAQLIFLKIIAEVFGCVSADQLEQLVVWLQGYLEQNIQQEHELAEKDFRVEQVKGRLRQSESDRKWAILGNGKVSVKHCDALFYQELSQENFDRDVRNFAQYLHEVQPDILTVAVDPCGVGPSTHFTSLQMIVQAVALYEKSCLEPWPRRIEIIGYRNVWSSFTIAQTSMIVAVTSEQTDQMASIFLNCFTTQQDPLFPSPLHDGSFADLVVQVQEHQGSDIRLLLGQQAGEQASYLFLQKLTVDQLVEFTKK